MISITFQLSSTFWPHLIHDKIYFFKNVLHTYYWYYEILCRIMSFWHFVFKLWPSIRGATPQNTCQRNYDSVNDGPPPLIHPGRSSFRPRRLVARHGAIPSHPADVVSLGLVLMNLAFAVSWPKKTRLWRHLGWWKVMISTDMIYSLAT